MNQIPAQGMSSCLWWSWSWWGASGQCRGNLWNAYLTSTAVDKCLSFWAANQKSELTETFLNFFTLTLVSLCWPPILWGFTQVIKTAGCLSSPMLPNLDSPRYRIELIWNKNKYKYKTNTGTVIAWWNLHLRRLFLSEAVRTSTTMHRYNQLMNPLLCDQSEFIYFLYVLVLEWT